MPAFAPIPQMPAMPNRGLGSLSAFSPVQQSGLNDFGIDRNSRDYAQDTRAALIRSDWAESRGRLTPLIDRLTFLYNNPQGRQETVQAAGNMAQQQVSQGRDQFARDAASTGLALAPDQKMEAERQFANAGSLSKLDAMNRSSRAFTDLRNNIALGGS